jgi:hypothetical protein
MTNALSTLPASIAGEPVRYGRDRWASNNGFRRAWLALGARHAAAINAARRGDLGAVLAHGETLGGLTQKRGWARRAIAAAQRLNADVPAYRIERHGHQIMVMVASLSWDYRGGRQAPKFAWTPMWGVRA